MHTPEAHVVRAVSVFSVVIHLLTWRVARTTRVTTAMVVATTGALVATILQFEDDIDGSIPEVLAALIAASLSCALAECVERRPRLLRAREAAIRANLGGGVGSLLLLACFVYIIYATTRSGVASVAASICLLYVHDADERWFYGDAGRAVRAERVAEVVACGIATTIVSAVSTVCPSVLLWALPVGLYPALRAGSNVVVAELMDGEWFVEGCK